MLPHLPPDARAQLLSEHAAIRRCGFHPELVASHSARELEIMRRYCHPDLVAVVLADHEQLEAVGSAGCGCS